MRGALLRLVRNRPVALAAGAALLGPSAWVELGGHDATWWADGLSLVVGATGAALLWTGLIGLRPDWVDDEPNR